MNLIWRITIKNNCKKSVALFFLLVGMTTITACSGGSSSTATGADGSGSPSLSGVFLDAPVEGLNYRTATMSGLTDEYGAFRYHEGETITFSIGDVMLGSAPGSDIMTPIDLVPGAMDETDPTVTNICRLLQSIDWDGDLSNGIMINENTRSEISGRPTIDVTKGMDAFNNYDVHAFFDTMNTLGGFHDGTYRELETPAQAQEHFRQTLMDHDMYQGDISSGPNQSGTGMSGATGMNKDLSGIAQSGGYSQTNN